MLTPQAIIDFWFTELTPQQWFVKDNKLDKLITERFKEIHNQASIGELDHWRDSIQGRLAEIIILDQFSRNIYRDTHQAFSQDLAALILAQEAVASSLDASLPTFKKSFLYMPFMHSESLSMQKKSLELFNQESLEKNYEFALEHKRIIEQFGRFPHRNKILRRPSTREEIEFLSINPGF